MSVDTTEATVETDRSWTLWVWLGTAVVVLVLVGLVVTGTLRPYVFSGTVIQSNTPAPPMDPLVYDNGDPVEIDALLGDVVLIYFGYTNCPDLCPTMLATVDRALGTLGERAERVKTMMVTVDPGRDSREFVGHYVRLFNSGFRGVWGSEQDVWSVATKYGVFFDYEEPDENRDYWVTHTASLMAVDPEGVLRLVYPVGVTAEELVRDLMELVG